MPCPVAGLLYPQSGIRRKDIALSRSGRQRRIRCAPSGIADPELHCPAVYFPAFSAPDMQQVNLGMIGGGTVGSGVFHALKLNHELMASRIGVRLNLRKVAVKAFDEPRP